MRNAECGMRNGDRAVQPNRRSAFFLTLEGGEGAGKSTQARALAQRLAVAGRDAVLTREPGGTPVGEIVRRLVLHHALVADGERVPVGGTAELLLFAASRAQLVDDVIRPALERGAVVICDRFADSTVAYQGYGRGIDLAAITQANAIATRGLTPDLTVLLDLPVETGLARRRGERSPDQFEREALAFHGRVRDGFLALAAAEPDRWLVLDARHPPPALTEAIWARLCVRLPDLV
jgi:dTMP kinase